MNVDEAVEYKRAALATLLIFIYFATASVVSFFSVG